jgi:microcystin-dependent protein
MTLRPRKIPTFAARPGTEIGFVENGRVVINEDFRRWLDQELVTRVELGNAPSAAVLRYAGSTEPAGWLLCNGQAVSKSTYANLYTIIGGTYGETSTTFNVPDYRNRIGMGAGSTVPLGGTAGATTATLSIANLPAHSHGVTDPGHSHAVDDPGHAHTVDDPGHTHSTGQPVGAVDSGTGTDTTSATSGTTGSSTTGVTVESATTGLEVNDGTTGIEIQDTGSGQSFSIVPPVVGVNWIIKA